MLLPRRVDYKVFGALVIALTEFDVLINDVVERLLMKGQVFFQPEPNFVEELESQLASSVNLLVPRLLYLYLRVPGISTRA